MREASWEGDLNKILVICLAVQLLGRPAFADTTCRATTLKTSALYFEHTGDEDKPIEPLVIATSQPGLDEIHCAAPRTLLIGSHWDVLVVKREEFTEAMELLARDVPVHKPAPHADFQYVLVSKPETVRRGPFDENEAIKLFVDLAKYFEGREPDLHEKLAILIRRIGGPQPPSP
jgi:hypothetical protein